MSRIDLYKKIVRASKTLYSFKVELFLWKFTIFNHRYAIGAKLDYTTITNILFQIAVFLVVYKIALWNGLGIDGLFIASYSVRTSWVLLEGHSAWQYEWNEGNVGDVGELGTAFLTSYLLFKWICSL